MTIIGTPYFIGHAEAARYYRDYERNDGFETVSLKEIEGLIHIGKPPLKPGQRLIVIDNGTRYAIVED